MATPQELPIPSAAYEASQAVEVFRAWIIGSGLQVSLQRGFDDPAVWGILFADTARHAARAFAAEKICTEHEALDAIKKMFDAEWKRPTDPGQTQENKRN